MLSPLPPPLAYQAWLSGPEEALRRGAAPALARVLSVLCANPMAEAFQNAVTENHPEIAASYLRTIRRPIDLGRVLRRAVAGAYNSAAGMQRCRRNVRRMLLNAEAFNSEDPLICSLAGHLRWFFNDLWLTAYAQQPKGETVDGGMDESRRVRGELLRGAFLPEAELRCCVSKRCAPDEATSGATAVCSVRVVCRACVCIVRVSACR